MEVGNDDRENSWDVDDGKSKCDDVVGKDDGEIDIPGFLVPFLR